jgi:hypothetical protein
MLRRREMRVARGLSRFAREFDSPRPAYPLPWFREPQLRGGGTVRGWPMPA